MYMCINQFTLIPPIEIQHNIVFALPLLHIFVSPYSCSENPGSQYQHNDLFCPMIHPKQFQDYFTNTSNVFVLFFLQLVFHVLRMMICQTFTLLSHYWIQNSKPLSHSVPWFNLDVSWHSLFLRKSRSNSMTHIKGWSWGFCQVPGFPSSGSTVHVYSTESRLPAPQGPLKNEILQRLLETRQILDRI